MKTTSAPTPVSFSLTLDTDILLDGGDLDFENDEPVEGEYISDFPTNEKPVE